jgi:hypothetical protein
MYTVLLSRRAFCTTQKLSKESLIGSLDLLAGSRGPNNSIERITANSIVFSSGVEVDNRHVALLISNKLLQFRPRYKIINGRIVDFDLKSLEFLKRINPHPDLYVVGLGGKSRLLSDANLKLFRELGIRVEVSDTRNACRSFNMLATERPGQVGALLLQ